VVTAASTGTNPDLRVEASALRAVCKLRLPRNGMTGKGDLFQVGKATFRKSDFTGVGRVLKRVAHLAGLLFFFATL
jgi:hypothetical protein